MKSIIVGRESGVITAVDYELVQYIEDHAELIFGYSCLGFFKHGMGAVIVDRTKNIRNDGSLLHPLLYMPYDKLKESEFSERSVIKSVVESNPKKRVVVIFVNSDQTYSKMVFGSPITEQEARTSQKVQDQIGEILHFNNNLKEIYRAEMKNN